MRSLPSITAAFVAALSLSCAWRGSLPQAERQRQVEELSALWSFYRFNFIHEGRVVALDENENTTSEGQSYAMLRSVWANDPWTFREVWRWTKENLQTRGDRLFAWKWKGRVLDRNSASDADVDVALALILASRRFSDPRLLEEARPILADIWAKDVLHVGGKHYVSAGNWAPGERYPTLHVAYFAPYAYEVFAGVDARRPWRSLVKSSYEVLEWLYFSQRVRAPPEIVHLDGRTGKLLLNTPNGKESSFGYDAVPIFWRLAVDERWYGRGKGELRRRVLSFFAEEWGSRKKIFDRYTPAGQPLSKLEGWPHLASIHALAEVDAPELAEALRAERLDDLREKALAGEKTPYYLHNWLWFDRAFELELVRHYDEFLGFLRPFDAATFWASFPWALLGAAILLAPFARRSRPLKIAFLVLAGSVSIRYLGWRLGNTLNFYETLGPAISIALWLAEAYSFSTVLLLVAQVGTRARQPRARGAMPDPLPTVDVFIPIYSESLDILDKTLTATAAMRYPHKRIHVCDDSHREAVARLAAEHGATYIKGPKKHAKAGNLNNAMSKTDGELIAVFDTDHLPVESFLEETVPCFADPRVGFVQTPHHFYNQDIFQRALGAGRRVPNEQDMFNHAIQGGRDTWGGSFFVGSGAVFRRRAIAELGGFKLLSITEDIHTSQHLHARGWKSAFIDKDLAVGLTAENLAGYIGQRRRWMLGCLQIFFKDNPLFCDGLSLRQRVGYFASLYYFFFPLARVVFFLTPLFFLLFHLHPLFADVSMLLAYLLPHMIVLPIAARVLLPGWPRILWGTLYETVVSFTLVRAMLDLLLPARLGFKVTPKGVTSERRRFDLASSRLTLIGAVIALVAVGKGIFEFTYFGIEKDAYFFNLAWASWNAVELLVALLIGWERPQRRGEERIARAIDVEIGAPGFRLIAKTRDVSVSGLALLQQTARSLPNEVHVALPGVPPLAAKLVYHERVGRSYRCAFHFVEPANEATRALVRLLFSPASAWEGAHRPHTRSSVVMAAQFVAGIARALMPLRQRRRQQPRARAFARWRCVLPDGARTVFVVDRSAKGLGLLVVGRPIALGTGIPLLGPVEPVRWARVVHQTRKGPGLQSVGLDLAANVEAGKEAVPHAYLAA